MALTRMFAGAELLGEALRETDDAEFRGRIRGAKGVAMPACGGRHVDDRSTVCRLEQRHGASRAKKLPGEADIDATAPFGVVDVLDTAGRPSDACIVYERVEAAQLCSQLCEKGDRYPPRSTRQPLPDPLSDGSWRNSRALAPRRRKR
jgi:hypothetical protein